jgi:D-alanine-D-alanine ligase
MLSAIENPITKSNFLTFEDKYKTQTKTKGTDRIIPAKISPELEDQIINYTSKIYKALNMNGVVRIDYIYDTQNNQLYFNEINTIPGSMAFYLYEPVGIDYISLVKHLINNATKPQQFKYFNTHILQNKKL